LAESSTPALSPAGPPSSTSWLKKPTRQPMRRLHLPVVLFLYIPSEQVVRKQLSLPVRSSKKLKLKPNKTAARQLPTSTTLFSTFPVSRSSANRSLSGYFVTQTLCNFDGNSNHGNNCGTTATGRRSGRW
jgi:hypothetical protein